MKTITLKEDALANIRVKKGFSIRGLAECAKINPATLCRIENGDVKPTPHTAKLICTTLGVEFDDVFIVKGE